ncbi:hypothetical protein D3C85_1833750 [compost metagenome]
MCLRNMNTKIGIVTAIMTATIGARLLIKAIKVNSLTALPIIMLGGSPINVAVPPIFDARI